MNLINIGQNKYFPSNSIQVFPCSYRGTNDTSIIDPEARMQTEANYTRLGGSEKTYVISYPTTSTSELVFMLNGYYFKVTGISAATDLPNDNVYLHIKLTEVAITTTNNTAVLSSWEDSAVKYLDKLGTSDDSSRVNGFTGLLITDAADTAGSDASIQVKANGAWNQAALLPNNIAHGETAGSIGIGAGLIASKDNQIIIGKYNVVNDAADIIIANGTDVENRSNKVIIESTETQLVNNTIMLSSGTADLELDAGGLHMTNGNNELNFTATDTQLTLKNKLAGSSSGNIVFIDGDNKLYKAPFGITLGADEAAEASIKYVSAIGYDNDGALTYIKRPIAYTAGTNQGQFKINGVDIDVKNLATTSSPQFENISIDEAVSAKTANFTQEVVTQKLTLASGSNKVELTTKDISASDTLTANHIIAKTDAKITTLKIGDATSAANNKWAQLSFDANEELQIKDAKKIGFYNGNNQVVTAQYNSNGNGELYASGSVKTQMLRAVGTNTASGLMFQDNTTNRFLIYNKNNSDLTIAQGNNTKTEYMSFNGNFTITAYRPITFNGKVTSEAEVTLKKSVTLSAALTSSSTITASKFTSTSDKRLKENIVDYKNDKSILDLPVYKFDYINGSKGNIGCLAQDLREICPELVHEDSNGYLSIEEGKLVYLLLNEVKQLRKEIDELKK